MNSSNETVPAYLVVCKFNPMWNGEQWIATESTRGQVFLKSTVDQRDVVNSLKEKALRKIYDELHDASCLPENFTFQDFEKSHQFKVEYIFEKPYQKKLFNERGELISKREFTQLEESDESDEESEESSEEESSDEESIVAVEKDDSDPAPFGYAIMGYGKPKNYKKKFCLADLVMNKNHPFHLLSTIFSKETIKHHKAKCPHFYWAEQFPRKTWKDIAQKELLFSFVEAAFDTYVPYNGMGEFRPEHYEDGITHDGYIRCKFCEFTGNEGVDSDPVTKKLLDSFLEIQKLLAPYLDFIQLVYKNFKEPTGTFALN